MAMALDDAKGDGLNVQINQTARKKMVAERKKARKLTRRAGGTGATAMDADYNFATDFV